MVTKIKELEDFEIKVGEELDAEQIEEIRSCDHMCTSNCRHEGCNCSCGEFHEPELVEALNK